MASSSEVIKVMPAYVADLEAAYGAPSQEGYGSAVFTTDPSPRSAPYRISDSESYVRYGGKTWLFRVAATEQRPNGTLFSSPFGSQLDGARFYSS